jgi:hypothetical protein
MDYIQSEMLSVFLNFLASIGFVLALLYFAGKWLIKGYFQYKRIYASETAELLKTVDAVIQHEFASALAAAKVDRETKVIDYEKHLQEMANNVIIGLGVEFFDMFAKSSKLSDNYLHSYIVRRTQALLFEHMKNNPVIER